MIVGEGMRDAQEEAFAVPGVGNKADTLAFRRAFGEILRREKLHEENGGPDKMTRSFLLRIMEHKVEVTAWHAALPKDKKRAWNHPSSVWRHFDKTPSKPKKLTWFQEKMKQSGLTETEEAEAVESAQIEALRTFCLRCP